MTALAEDLSAQSTLANGLSCIGIELPPQALGSLLRYVDLLEKWNRVYNLTAVRGFEPILRQHLLDSLSVLPWISGRRVLDVGSGAGLPGIPLAIARPEMSVTLLDANEKKTAFLQQVAAELALRNVTVARQRVEQFAPAERYDLIVTRAFAELGQFVNTARHLLEDHGRLIAMKGQYPAEELRQLPAWARVVELKRIQVPGLNAERHIVVMAAAGPG